jgi:TonB family protein
LSGIFVSYRRSDSQGEAGRLFDDLVQHFDEQTVFMDVSAIEAGRDFRKAIEEGVTKCGVLLVVIGPDWLNAKDEHGARRLDDAGDFVRIETASALRRDIPVIPVLVRAARMPSAEQLPDDLKDLAYRNCIELTHARWKSDVRLLTESLRRLVGSPGQTGQGTGVSGAAAQTDSASQVEPSKPEIESAPRIDSAGIERVSRELALHIGPIASVVVKRAASHCSSVDDLYLKVADEIDSQTEREKFLKRAAISATPLPEVARIITAASETPAVKEASPAKENRAVLIAPPATPTTIGSPSSSGWKYWLIAGVCGIALIGALVLGIRSRSTKEPGQAQTTPLPTIPPQTSSPQTTQNSPQPKETAELPPVKTGEEALEAVSVQKSDHPKPAQRVRVPQEVSQGLLIKKVVPEYPPLARQAHIQGMVIFNADISKDGAVETLKIITGHPLLVPAALEAVKQWRYKPYLLNGESVAVSTQIEVNFTLKGG